MLSVTNEHWLACGVLGGKAGENWWVMGGVGVCMCVRVCVCVWVLDKNGVMYVCAEM